jgi:ABC-2 type transport system ATP-binding protein
MAAQYKRRHYLPQLQLLHAIFACEATVEPKRRSPMEHAVEADELHMSFGKGATRVLALNRLSLTIPAGGGVHGILGKNGAGKSTLFRILLGLSAADSGSVRVFGAPPASTEVLGRIGAAIETPCFFGHLTGEETLTMLALLHGKHRAASPAALLERIGLSDCADRKVNGYSIGMKQRLAIAAALISRPEMVVLDEPTSGMDIVGTRQVRQLLRELAERDGINVVLASHQIEEITKTCDSVTILHGGRVAAEGKVDDMLQGRSRLRLAATPVDRVLQRLGSLASRDGDGVVAAVARHEAPELLASLMRDGIEVYEARWINDSFENIVLGHFRGLANA